MAKSVGAQLEAGEILQRPLPRASASQRQGRTVGTVLESPRVVGILNTTPRGFLFSDITLSATCWRSAVSAVFGPADQQTCNW
jgi:hypothetical protein